MSDKTQRPNSKWLAERLRNEGWTEESASVPTFPVDTHRLHHELHELRKHHADPATIEDRATFRCLMAAESRQDPAPEIEPGVRQPEIQQDVPLRVECTCNRESSAQAFADLHQMLQRNDQYWRTFWKWAVVGLAVLLVLVCTATKVHAQNVNPDIVVALCGTPPSNYPSAGQRTAGTVDTNGNECISGSISATSSLKSTAAAPSYAEGSTNAFSSDLSGNLRVTGSFSPAPVSDTVATATLGALNAVIQVATAGQNGVVFYMTGGSLNGTLTATGSVDGGTAYNVAAFLVDVNGTTSATKVVSGGGTYQMKIGTYVPVDHIQLKVTSYTSGTSSGRLTATAINPWDGMTTDLVTTPNRFMSSAIYGSAGALFHQDGSNNMIVSGTVAATESGTWNIATVTAVTAITNALPAGSNVIGHVIADTGSTTAVTGNVAVTKADGSDVTFGAKADAKSTATDTTAVTAMQVLKEISFMEQTPASRAVTNAGTFATQSAITAASGSIASGAIASGAVASGAFASGSISDGAEVTLGAKADAKSTATDTTSITAMQVLKEISFMLQTPAALAAGSNTIGNVLGTLSDNGAAATSNRLGTLPGVARSNYPSAKTAGRDSSLSQDLYGVTWIGQMPTGLTTYVASGSGTLSSNATDIAVMPGNATNTVIVTAVTASCTQTTAGINNIMLIKRSAADSGGSSTSMNVTNMDTSDTGGVSAPLFYTANPTLGATAAKSGLVDQDKIGIMAAGTTSPNDIYVWPKGPAMGEQVVLRGTAQQLAVNFGGSSPSGAACNVTFKWIETTGL